MLCCQLGLLVMTIYYSMLLGIQQYATPERRRCVVGNACGITIIASINSFYIRCVKRFLI